MHFVHFKNSSSGPDWTPQRAGFGARTVCLKPLTQTHPRLNYRPTWPEGEHFRTGYRVSAFKMKKFNPSWCEMIVWKHHWGIYPEWHHQTACVLFVLPPFHLRHQSSTPFISISCHSFHLAHIPIHYETQPLQQTPEAARRHILPPHIPP